MFIKLYTCICNVYKATNTQKRSIILDRIVVAGQTQQAAPNNSAETMRDGMELGRKGLNGIEMFGSRPAVQAADTDVWWHPPACFA